jgi:predicted nucleotidyltransferase
MQVGPLKLDDDALRAFCERWGIVELALFGSVLRDDFGPDSDVDVLVTCAPEARRTAFEHLRAERELARLLGRPVDLVERRALDEDRNVVRRQRIAGSARVVYAA